MWESLMEEFKVAYSNGDLEEAERLLLEALEVAEMQRERGPLVEGTLTNLANVYRDMGAYDKAEELYKQVLDYWDQAFEPGEQVVISILRDLGIICHSQYRFEEAETFLSRALDHADMARDSRNTWIATISTHLGEVYGELKNFDKAEQLFKRALKIHSEDGREKEAAIVLSNLMVLHQQRQQSSC
jgi:tetratricopeptide (TPR) repeat protein